MAIDPYALTTLANAKEHLRITGTDEDSLVTNLINAVSAKVETHCARQFLTRSHSEWYDGPGTEWLLLRQLPVTAVTLLSVGFLGALQVQNTSSDATRAMVSVSSTQVTLTIVGGVNAGSDNVTFTLNISIAAMATAINALGKNWTATALSPYTHILSTELVEKEALYCLDTMLTLDIPDKPVSDYELHGDEGMIYRAAGFTSGVRNVRLLHTAGYATVPYDLELIVLEILAESHQKTKRDTSLKSEKLRTYSWTAADVSISDRLKEKLSLWRRTV